MSKPPAPSLPSVAVIGPLNLGVRGFERSHHGCAASSIGIALHCGVDDMFERFPIDDFQHADIVVHVDYDHPLQLAVGRGPLDVTVRMEERRTGRTLLQLRAEGELIPGRADLTVAMMLKSIARTLDAELYGRRGS